jgi:hypothetical protein
MTSHMAVMPPVTVTADGLGRYGLGRYGLGRYGLEIESAVYFCCLEALQNAAKHAAGAQVEVRLWEESGGLLFSVSDDGPGFDVALARGGHGYTNMADRLSAIGGTVRWDSAPARARGSAARFRSSNGHNGAPAPSRQNSSPSGSARTIQPAPGGWSTAMTAPRPSSRVNSSRGSPSGGRRSR